VRGQIIDAIFAEMEHNDDIYFLTADMGINLVEKFGEKFPDRYANVGIAEQNLIGVGAGLANLGYRPFAYTISNFVIHRCLEQIRNDIGIHRYPITLLGTSTGFDNAPLGPTHHIIDEWGSLQSLPEIDIYCPSSVTYASTLVQTVLSEARPAYIRIPKGEHREPDSKEHMVHLAGNHGGTALISYGNPLQACLQARDTNPELGVIAINRLRPLPDAVLKDALSQYGTAIVVEDHFPNSGLYGSLCEFVNRHQIPIRLFPLAPTDYTFDVGTSPEYFSKKFGLDADGVLNKVAEISK
jgi:transketolase